MAHGGIVGGGSAAVAEAPEIAGTITAAATRGSHREHAVIDRLLERIAP